MITLEADCKLIPTPPALVEHRNTNDDTLALKLSTKCCRVLVGVEPSKRVKGHPWAWQKAPSTSKVCVDQLNTRTYGVGIKTDYSCGFFKRSFEKWQKRIAKQTNTSIKRNAINLEFEYD